MAIVLKLNVPVLPLRSSVPPLLPLLWSQAWKVRPLLTVPFQWVFGTKRTKVMLASYTSAK